MATDQEIRDAGYKFISPQQYLQNPFVIPTEEEEVTETFGIPYTGAFTRSGGGGGGGGAPINYQTDRNYRPGGRYERNPLFSGVLSTTVGQDRFGRDQIVPNYGRGDELSELQLSYMDQLPPGASKGDLSLMQRLNLGARNLFGVNSAYESGRKTGKLGDFVQGIVPFQNIPKMLGAKPVGDWSPRRRWAVEGGEWGTGTGRDEFGVMTGGKTLTGKTADYSERMGNRVNELRDFFGIGTTPLNELTSHQVTAMKKKNNANFKQLLDYETKQGILDEDEQAKGLLQQQRVALANRNIKKAGDIDLFGYQRGVHEGEGGITGGGSNLSKIANQGGFPIAPGTFTAESIDQSFQGEEGGQTQGQKDTEAAQKDDPGLGGHKKGGRVGYRGGQLVRPGPGRPGYGGPQDWGQEERKEGPYSGGGGDGVKTVTHGGGDGIKLDYITKKPSLTVNKSFLNDKANLRAQLYYENLLENDDLKSTAQLQYGPATLTMDPNSNLNLGYSNNIKGWDVNTRTNLQDAASLSAAKNGWGVNLTHDPEGTNFNVGWSKTLGGPEEETYNTQALSDIFVSPTVDEDIRLPIQYGGLVGIL